jgi:hypothetical protein
MKRVSIAQRHPTCSGPQLGTWKLRSFTTTYRDNDRKVEPYGAHPNGYLHYGSDCRMYVIIAHESRKPPLALVLTDTEKLELFDGFAGYAGTYTIDGDRISHHVDISWNQAWTGTSQIRQFKIDGNSLRIRSLPEPDFLDGRVTSSELLWAKVQ